MRKIESIADVTKILALARLENGISFPPICKTCNRDRTKFCNSCEDIRDRAIRALSEYASAMRVFILASDDDRISITKFKAIGARVKRASKRVLQLELATHHMAQRDIEANAKYKPFQKPQPPRMDFTQ
jgi:hypothetical protein